MQPIRTSESFEVYKLGGKQRALFLESIPHYFYSICIGNPVKVYYKGESPLETGFVSHDYLHDNYSKIEYEPVVTISHTGIVLVDKQQVARNLTHPKDITSLLRNIEELGKKPKEPKMPKPPREPKQPKVQVEKPKPERPKIEKQKTAELSGESLRNYWTKKISQ